jgi:chemotaxis protein MotB
MKTTFLTIIAGTALLLASCSAPRKLREAQAENARLDSLYRGLQNELLACENARKTSSTDYEMRIKNLNEQLSNLKSSNTQVLGQLKDLSVISDKQAESINRSLENIGAKDNYIMDLQSAIARKDSLNMALVMNLKGAIGNMNDADINIKVDKGVVYIDISDKLLFKSGSFEVNESAKTVLGKVATVLKNQPDIEFMVEGHTDNVPYRASGSLQDNWDLSVKRATSVVRILQNQYNIPPARMTAAGRGEFVPVSANTDANGKAANRRTRIVILPELDQFFKLLERPQRK